VSEHRAAPCDSASLDIMPASVRTHRLQRMLGRDPRENHRTVTPLELLFDLTFVVAFSFAGNEVAHGFAEGHWSVGIEGFLFATFGIIWAWINFSWFASAFETDDWGFRLVTLVQMLGVVIFALGIPPAFASLEAHQPLGNRVIVLGYVVMRVAMVVHWVRTSRQCPPATAVLPDLRRMDRDRAGRLDRLDRSLAADPGCAGHITERYRLLAIIALGEGIVGATASLSAAVEAAHGH